LPCAARLVDDAIGIAHLDARELARLAALRRSRPLHGSGQRFRRRVFGARAFALPRLFALRWFWRFVERLLARDRLRILVGAQPVEDGGTDAAIAGTLGEG